MSLYVNTNTIAINANRQLYNSGLALDKSYERLSSGFRINSASDDAAGLQISDRLTTQVNGFNQAVRNANDGISVVQTAEGALNEITTALQRMRVLAVQAENGINGVADKLALQKELAQLKSEIDRIASSTEFAGSSLLDGSYSSSFLVGANSNQNINVSLLNDSGYGSKGLSIQGLNVLYSNSPKDLENYEGESITNSNFPLGVFATVPNPSETGVISGLLVNIDNQGYIEIPDFSFPTSSAGANSNIFVNQVNSYAPNSFGRPSMSSAANFLLFTSDTTSVQFKIKEGGDVSFINRLTGIPESLLTSINSTNFESNLTIIDRAIAFVADARSYLGATQNRFQSTIRNISNISENVSAARSQIRDTDYTLETANLTRNEIVQQASISVLAQANTQPQIALQLLR